MYLRTEAFVKGLMSSEDERTGGYGTPAAYGDYRNSVPHGRMKKLFALLILGIAGALPGAAAPIDLGYTAGYTPYDSYMRPVRTVLRQLDGEGTSMDRVRSLMRKGRNFRYSYENPYIAMHPRVTEARRAGDCKDKALWLADNIGDENIRFVVGKARRDSRISHAWLMWENEGRWWVLDCTNTSQPIPVDRLSRNEYIPLYSWGKSGTYRHSSTRIMTAHAVAGKRTAPVASR
jgi:hypothetical protein